MPHRTSMFSRLLTGLCASLLATMVGFGPVHADGIEPVSPPARLKAMLEQFDSLEADFVQVTLDSDRRSVQESSGRLWVHTPARFRIETTEPFVQTLVSDGVNFWTYDADLEQVIVRVLEKDVEQIPVLLLGGAAERIESEYDVTFYEDETITHFVLEPLSPSSLFESLGLEFTGDVPHALSISDSIGQRTRIVFSDIKTNGPVAEEHFSFAAPAGVDVIDDRPGVQAP